MAYVLPFEKPFHDLLSKVRALRELAAADASLLSELGQLQAEADRVARGLFAELSPWQRVQLSRHPDRPYSLDYVNALCEDFVELAGDRQYANDLAIVAGFARFRGRNVIVVGHQKGRGAKENILRNFGMPHPEGYRKAERIYALAGRFGLPILTFIDTPGAFPGIGAEERGQSEAIGSCLAAMARAPVPIICTIIGEGGSGGALALGVGNRVNMLEFSTYSVITPEGCASILWKDGAMAETAAARLRMTAPDLFALKIVEEVLPEPVGGAHHAPAEAAKTVGDALERALVDFEAMTAAQLVEQRYCRFRALGHFVEV